MYRETTGTFFKGYFGIKTNLASYRRCNQVGRDLFGLATHEYWVIENYLKQN